MSKSLYSPTANLLRSSRLFSLPRPLPQPGLDITNAQGSYRQSDTATLPYPVYQAISTPASAHARGDWGLKRAIPRKTTSRSTTPVIRVRAQDNTEHITDFESAADHVITERKWRQMGIPLMTKEQRTTFSGDRNPLQSVYDDHLDITDRKSALLAAPETSGRSTGRGTVQQNTGSRWKYEGPWIPGMQEGEFNEYVTSTLAKRRTEFRAFLMKRIVEIKIRQEERRNREAGQGGPMTAVRVAELRQHVAENFDAEEKKLRDDHIVQNLSSELTSAICDFLDLPGIQIGSSPTMARTQLLQNHLASLGSGTGPPSTHPGAGLSHLRTNAVMENHPYWGPQASRAPVKARVLRPRTSSIYTEFQAKIGVGGVVTNDPISASYQSSNRLNTPGYSKEEKEEHYLDADRMTNSIDENLPGGNKIWVQPEHAHIDEQGRINLFVSRGDKEAIAVRRDKVAEIHEARSASFSGPGYVGRPGPGESANYGYSLPDMRQNRSSVRGFDEELGRSPQQGQMPDRNEAARRIRELMASTGARPRRSQGQSQGQGQRDR